MLLPLKLICQSKAVRKDGTAIIWIQYCYSSEHRTNLNTEIAIPPLYWDQHKFFVSTELPQKYGNANRINEELKRMFRSVEDLVAFAIKNNIEDKGTFIKRTFTPGFDIHSLSNKETENAIEDAKGPKFNKDFYFQLDDYIKSKEKKVSIATVCVLRCMKYHLKAFDSFRKKKTLFESLDFNYYDRLVEFLTFEYTHKRRKTIISGLKLNTIGKTVKQLRVFVRDRFRRKIIPFIDLSDFKIPEEEPDAIYLSYEEVSKIYHLELSEHPHLLAYKNLFVLACLTGLRFSDFSVLKIDDVRGNLLYKKQQKSEHWVVVPLRNEAKDILVNYFKEGIPKVTNAEFNRHIKTIGRLAGIADMIKFSYKKGNKTIEVKKLKYNWITTHTARRSFCTNEFLAGTPVKLIMKISGHKKEQDFYRYIKITPEEAAQKIQELWIERNNMSAFGEELKSAS